MKKIVTFFALLFVVSGAFLAPSCYGQVGGIQFDSQKNYDPNRKEIPNGTYWASVRYYNHKTNYRANYTLQVVVRSGEVIAILFDNGGSLHRGTNNSNYNYAGGSLYYVEDSYGRIVKAYCDVSVYDYDSQSLSTFEIVIQ